MTTIRNILRDYRTRPVKRLGQSFLEDKNCIEKIVRIADIRDDQVVVEIGAGVGLMTAAMAKKARRVIALDIDPRMVAILKERMASYANVEIVLADVLEYDFSAAAREADSGKIKVVGNIPYNISSQILFSLLSYRDCISSMILMFQKELADRLVATPGTKAYGVPSALVSMYLVSSREMTVPRTCFYPRPDISSSVLKMTVLEKPLIDLTDDDFFFKLVKMVFGKRRKTVLNNLKSLQTSGSRDTDILQALEAAGIEGKRRGETLSAAELGRLANAFCSIKMA
ncbi:MAG TPA: 16S rRNA (adenine(1518)-N(6)/adenine(1519)-N(6))-dimethyltransferase RsmA [Syntrophales bacterium]|nr:16S rRNA (adenine(1518)-N(6)/adenine(1519)-N(6))-dimethyltransferase RsmA [Syntrophales bacterium]